jgi:hypothetical protein
MSYSKMKKNQFTIILLFAVLFVACAAPKSTGVWINAEKIQGKQFSKVFIVVMTADIEARSKIENDLAEEATERGYSAVKSMDIMPPNIKDPATPVKEDILTKVKESGCDAVFAATLLRQEEDVRYTPGVTGYSIMPYYRWHGNVVGYYSHWHPFVFQPGYYAKDKSYFMQSNLYDVATEEIMWSVQSEVFNPSSVAKFSKSYTGTLIKQLEKEGLLRK